MIAIESEAGNDQEPAAPGWRIDFLSFCSNASSVHVHMFRHRLRSVHDSDTAWGGCSNCRDISYVASISAVRHLANYHRCGGWSGMLTALRVDDAFVSKGV